MICGASMHYDWNSFNFVTILLEAMYCFIANKLYSLLQPVNHDVDGNVLGGSRDLRIRSDQGAFEERGGVTFVD